MVESNRRLFPRKNTVVSIQVLVVPENPRNREKNIEIIPAKMANQSQEGLYLETDRALQPGSNVALRINGSEVIPPSDNAYRIHDGRIIWCHKIDDDPPRFGIGIKILRRAVQADIITSRFNPSGAGAP